MNFLAHMLLSCRDEEMLIGNYLADFIKNRNLESYSEGIREGIYLHRKIDQFTDTHPVIKAATKRLRARHSRYAGVCLDIYLDYILCQQWSQYSPKPLDIFCEEVYETLLKYQSIMPPKTAEQTSRMVADKWLPKYGTYEGIEYTFFRLSSRVSRPEMLIGAVETLKMEEEQLNKDFSIFFPEIMLFVQEACAC